MKWLLPGVVAIAPILLSAAAGRSFAAEEAAASFAIRGTLPWHNFLSGPTAWDEEDYQAYLDRLAARKLNFVGFHCYTGGAERYAPYVEPMIRIEYRNVVPEAGFDTSLTARWGYRPLAVGNFPFGTARLFELPPGATAFGARSAVTATSNEDRYRQAQKLMRTVLAMAHQRGIQMAMGFEFGIHPPELASIVPPDSRIPGAMLPDPTHPANVEILQATLDDVLRAYPGIDWIWLWLHEHTMFIGKPRPSGRFQELLDSDGKLFADAGAGADQENVTFTGVWSLEYIRQAQAYLARRAPKVRLAIGGWGGGPQLTPVLRGLDRGLPRQIVFSCLNPAMDHPHPTVLAEIARRRPVWAIPWLEGDGWLWHLQPRAWWMLDQVQAAHRDGLSGVLGIHWRTEEIRANLEAFALAAHDPRNAPSAEAFYREDCRRHYGPESVAELAPLLVEIDRRQWLLGPPSPEFYPYDPSWGRLGPELKEKLKGAVASIERIKGRTTQAPHRANLDWLADNLRFALLLDEVGRKIEPAYRLKDRRVMGRVDGPNPAEEARAAEKALRAAPIEELFRTFARRVRSRGELGELSALSQKLWLEYRELERFLTP